MLQDPAGEEASGAPGSGRAGQGREIPPGCGREVPTGTPERRVLPPWRNAKFSLGPTSSLPSPPPPLLGGPSRSALSASAGGAEQDQTRRSGFDWLEIPVLGAPPPQKSPGRAVYARRRRRRRRSLAAPQLRRHDRRSPRRRAARHGRLRAPQEGASGRLRARRPPRQWPGLHEGGGVPAAGEGAGGHTAAAPRAARLGAAADGGRGHVSGGRRRGRGGSDTVGSSARPIWDRMCCRRGGAGLGRAGREGRGCGKSLERRQGEAAPAAVESPGRAESPGLRHRA